MAGNCDFMLQISLKVRVIHGMMPVDLSSIFLMQAQINLAITVANLLRSITSVHNNAALKHKNTVFITAMVIIIII